MIIALYESNYPVVFSGEPDWQALPTAYFQLAQGQMTQHENKPLYGKFIYAHGNRPRIGEFLLAAFSYKQERYLYNASLDYADTYEIASVVRKQQWAAKLCLLELIKQW